jgi:hypothetical protein
MRSVKARNILSQKMDAFLLGFLKKETRLETKSLFEYENERKTGEKEWHCGCINRSMKNAKSKQQTVAERMLNLKPGTYAAYIAILDLRSKMIPLMGAPDLHFKSIDAVWKLTQEQLDSYRAK